MCLFLSLFLEYISRLNLREMVTKNHLLYAFAEEI